jgi:hypothetical protein
MYIIDGVPCGPLLLKNMSKHNVLFNQHVKEIIAGLQENWLLTFSRHTLLSVTVSSSSYMRNKRDDYTDGAAMNDQTLMTSALANYNSIQEEGVWNDTSPDQKRLVALSSEVSQLKEHNIKLNKNLNIGNSAVIGKEKAKKDKPKTQQEEMK